MKQRQDAWSEEDDLLLAETVLRHVREGSTQLNAFEEVGDKLNRTSAACGFRWNAVVRHNYEKALQLAKKQRKQKMRATGKGQPAKKQLLYSPQESEAAPEMTEAESFEIDNEELPAVTHPVYKEEVYKEESYEIPYTARRTPAASADLTMSQVVAFLESYSSNNEHVNALKLENERLKRENYELSRRNQDLAVKVSQLEQDTVMVQEDYETLMKIMNRARKLVLFEEEERPATKFKMDRNGNLEKLAE
ncbi:RsfA family transcriptional regulator [Metabacillus dongyingensis]|jgi:prespore-specific regulator|uniref:RsfA family transcriptional regulator n=1 Tax=Metabacillus dongyingensis TaxID=2874282 RepID=UPI003B8D5708